MLLQARLEIGRTYLDHARMLAARGRLDDWQRMAVLADQAHTVLSALGLHPLAQRAAELTPAFHAP
jgi:hypothetical protein